MERLKNLFSGLKWWKWAVLLIMPYVILMGFLVPLGQGITSITPGSTATGANINFRISAYNSQFSPDKSNTAWLKYHDLHLPAKLVKVLSPQEAEVIFDIPVLPDKSVKFADLSLIINTPEGPAVLPSAVSLRNIALDSTTIINEVWSDNKLNINKEANFNYPFRNLMAETIRNIYFHVPLWFAMTFVFMFSVFYSIRYLRKKDINDDQKALSLIAAGMLFGILGCITGAMWAKYTWGQYWSFDVKQNMAAISLLIYSGYFLLRKSLSDPDAKSRIGNIYSIFAFCMLIPLIFIIPRRYDSLHPGNGGNPALGADDLDNTMRTVFYPAVIAYICLGFWLAELNYRIIKIKNKIESHETYSK
ncbi:MAG: cytochrome c biogenesis protein CcsA [Saprospiraceae bacterium]